MTSSEITNAIDEMATDSFNAGYDEGYDIAIKERNSILRDYVEDLQSECIEAIKQHDFDRPSVNLTHTLDIEKTIDAIFKKILEELD